MTTFQWANDPNPLSITPKFIVPDENKPNLTNISHLDSIPIVDMNNDHEVLIHDISRACEEYGFFQLINHGIPKDLCENVLEVITEFFHLPYEDKVDMLSVTHMEDGKLFKYYIKDEKTKEKIFMWGEALFHTWHPVDVRFVQNLPTIPPSYRKVVATYIKEVASLITQLLSLISQSLGLDEDYLQRRLGENPKRTAQANYYPPCPNPDLTLGLRDHTDINILTILLADEGVTGLQVLKAEKWFEIDPVPGALIVNVADQLQVLSNDKYKSVQHRAVTNDTKKRTSFAVFIGPEEHGFVGPIQELLDENNPPKYRNYTIDEFMREYRNQEGKRRMVKEFFKIDSGVNK
ncbi:flavanone 3-dioxygenase 2-like [Silene latifolia]|uniref:flavanone 3-dioxygenase 2-like n=1 Tax=Silene latifolia TaxID=37657 RepID=UPI003D78219B